MSDMGRQIVSYNFECWIKAPPGVKGLKVDFDDYYTDDEILAKFKQAFPKAETLYDVIQAVQDGQELSAPGVISCQFSDIPLEDPLQWWDPQTRI